jgi:hypothetical protein
VFSSISYCIRKKYDPFISFESASNFQPINLNVGVTDVNAMGFILLSFHQWLVLNLYLIFSLVLVHY